MEIKTVLITQARTGSTRLPGKVLMEVNQMPLLKIHLDRLKKSKNIDKIIVATTHSKDDDIIEKLSNEWAYDIFRGSENDVLDRFYNAVKNINPLWVVRVTSDCPLIDPLLVDQVVSYVQDSDMDYGSNTLVEQFPDGQDIEVFKFSTLEKAWRNANLFSEREHVTPYIINNSTMKGGSLFNAINYACHSDFSKIRMTVDEIRDFNMISILINSLGTDKTWLEYTNHILENGLNKINDTIIRNEGLLKSLKNDKK